MDGIWDIVNGKLICVCIAVMPSTLTTGVRDGGPPPAHRLYIGMIKSAIRDEMAVATSVTSARRYGVQSGGGVRLRLDVLIAPFTPITKGFSTHVIYLITGYGYVIRVVDVWPEERLALFGLGYALHRTMKVDYDIL